ANTTTPAGLPLLHTAAERGDLQLVQLLLEQGATVNLLSREGKTPALIAVDKGHKSVANRLIKAAGAGDIETILAEAVAREDVKVLSRLLPVAELGGSQFRQLFHQAAVNKQRPVVNYFAMQSTLSVEIAFLMAVYNNELGAVTEFLKAGIYKSRGCSPSYLLMAAVRREEEKVKTFIQGGVDASNDIKLAAQARETEALSVLVSGFADIEARNQQVEALIFREVDDPSVLSSLVAVERDSGAAGLRAILFSILARSTKAHNVLHSALERIQTIDDENPGENQECAPAQYRQGKGPRVSDVETPIASSLIRQSCTDAIKHNQAQLKQNQAVIQALINAGVDLDITDDRGVSFLAQAIQGNCQDIVRSILDCWKRPDPLLDNSAAPQPDGRINTYRSMILTDALELAIGLDRQHMIMLLLDAVNGMKNVQFDRSRLDGNSNILYRIAHMGNTRLLRELWQLGFRATPSLQQIVHRADKNKLQQLVAAGVKLNATDVGSQMHPLLLAVTLRATDLPLVRSMVAITDNLEDVICDQALKTQKEVLSQLCQIVAEDHTRIMNMLVRAANGENHGLFQTLAGVQQMAGQLGRCLSDAAHRGHNKVVSELLNVGVDINDSNLGLFLYETALEHPDIAKLMVDHWQGKANRNCRVIIKESVNLANHKPGSQQICVFLNSLSGMARSEEC
ncbi:ankyrin repeat domain-containing protein, partial [Endozoicomonas sp. ONNA2]|uniref:ankyrin repeat domain-containing protein n=1 Tax=Endozoicomonas sp. ONNA2 TaxID=2828741 RepID=UPI0021472A89